MKLGRLIILTILSGVKLLIFKNLNHDTTILEVIERLK